MIIGIVGGVLVLCGIAVLVLWLTVWKDGGSGSATPVALAEKYIGSLEKSDVGAYKACFEPDTEFMDEFLESSFATTDFKFEDVSLEVESETAEEATVVTTGGTAIVSSIIFDVEVDLADEPMELEMVKKDGKWYLLYDPLDIILSGAVDFEDMDFEDLDELLPEDLEDLIPEDLDLEDLENLIPEELDFENISPEELEQMLEDLEKLMEDLPQG